MTLPAGTLNRRIFVEKRGITRDPEGGEIVDWVPLGGDGMLWSNPRLLNGTETLKSDTPIATARGSFRIRFREDIDATCRVTYAGKVYEILAVLPDLENREHVDLAVQSGANDG